VPAVLWQDLGFIGLEPENADGRIPNKKPKEKELLDQEKAFNPHCNPYPVSLCKSIF
jgi:hypothetical protein